MSDPDSIDDDLQDSIERAIDRCFQKYLDDLRKFSADITKNVVQGLIKRGVLKTDPSAKEIEEDRQPIEDCENQQVEGEAVHESEEDTEESGNKGISRVPRSVNKSRASDSRKTVTEEKAPIRTSSRLGKESKEKEQGAKEALGFMGEESDDEPGDEPAMIPLKAKSNPTKTEAKAKKLTKETTSAKNATDQVQPKKATRIGGRRGKGQRDGGSDESGASQEEKPVSRGKKYTKTSNNAKVVGVGDMIKPKKALAKAKTNSKAPAKMARTSGASESEDMNLRPRIMAPAGVTGYAGSAGRGRGRGSRLAAGSSANMSSSAMSSSIPGGRGSCDSNAIAPFSRRQTRATADMGNIEEDRGSSHGISRNGMAGVEPRATRTTGREQKREQEDIGSDEEADEARKVKRKR